MDPREVETLVARLIANPHDEDALSRAHQAGQMDPQGYASLLERVAQGTTDPTFAAHWLSEAASVWETLGDTERQFRLMYGAVDRDPSNVAAVQSVVEVLRGRGQHQDIAKVLERAVEAWAAGLHEDPDFRQHLVQTHEELARLYSEGALSSQPDAALRHWAALCELDAQNVLAIYSARELLKSQERYAEAVPYFAKEQTLADDPERRLALYRDEAETRRLAGDAVGRTEALRQARALQADDPALTYEFAVSVVDRIDAGEDVPAAECKEASQSLLELAEMYEGEHAMMYAAAALKAAPADDRAMQLADFHAEQIGRTGELADAYRAYLRASPEGFMASKAQGQLAALGEPTAMPATPSAPVGAAAPPPADAPPPVGSAPQAVASQGAAPAELAGGEASTSEADVPRLLAEAADEAQRGRKPQAYGKYREVLAIDPANSEALSWVEDFLRQRRKFSDLRDVLLAASRVTSVSVETRKAQLRDVAGLCESKLRDFETAINAWKQLCQIDRGDQAAREQLCALLEKQKRWDDLAPMLEQEAMNEPDLESKITIEKKIAQLHEKRRKDPVAAAEAWVRIAELTPGDESAVQTAVDLYEQGQDFDAAAGVIVDQLAQLDDIELKSSLLGKLAGLRTQLGDLGGAGDAYAEAAELSQKDTTWEQAATSYGQAERWADAANVIEQRAMLHDGARRAELLAEAGEALVRAGNPAAALVLFEQAADLDPPNDEHAARVENQYQAEARQADQVAFLLRRADALEDRDKRIALRHRAAQIQWSLGDEEGACDSLRQVLSDGEDREALEALYQAAERRADHMDAVDLLQRLVAMSDGEERLNYALREAQIVAEGLSEVDLAVDRYEKILAEYDKNNRVALRAIGDLERRRDNHDKAAEALERELKLVEGEERVEIAGQLAELYEGPIGDLEAAVRVLDIIHQADPQDFDAIARLQVLCEKLENWPRVCELLRQLIEVEGDEEEASEMTRQLATLLQEKLGKVDEALAALEQLADQGDVACQQAYMDVGIEANWKGIVAQKLVQWNEGVAGTSRVEALRKAFELFVEVERDPDARAVALDLAGSKDLDHEMAGRLEEIAARLRDLEALAVAHDVLAAELSGLDRAIELVRQAETMATAGAEALDAIQHGEQGLASIEPIDAEDLLNRLAVMTGSADDVLDLYERQVARCRKPAERINALARAAQVAAERGALDRAREFFNAALAGGVNEETIEALEIAAQRGQDEGRDAKALLQTLAEALAGGGQGSRDGGRTRSSLLRRAAVIAHRELDDVQKAFGWLADSIIAHVDEATLDALEELGLDVGEMARVDEALTRALDEVFDGPLVRRLLRRRASVRRDHMQDLKGAAADLKRLHDLSPSDQPLTDELSALLTDLQDHRGMIELYEDQILRGREPTTRAELARKVARIWEEQIGDARESADAWRRVLRMRAGDDEAQAGLERAKTGKLKRPPPAPKSSLGPPEASHPQPEANAAVVVDSSVSEAAASPPPPASQPPSPGSQPPAAGADSQPPAAMPPAPALDSGEAAASPAPPEAVAQQPVAEDPWSAPAAQPAEPAPVDGAGAPAGQPPAEPAPPQPVADPWAHAAAQPGHADPYAGQAAQQQQAPADPWATQQQQQVADPYAQGAGQAPQDPYAAGGYGQQPPGVPDPYAAAGSQAPPQAVPDPYAAAGSQPPPQQGWADPYAAAPQQPGAPYVDPNAPAQPPAMPGAYEVQGSQPPPVDPYAAGGAQPPPMQDPQAAAGAYPQDPYAPAGGAGHSEPPLDLDAEGDMDAVELIDDDDEEPGQPGG